jgi:hypothetical protein
MAQIRPLQGWEEDFLRLAYPTESGGLLASVLGRTRSAIGYYARKLGLTKPEKITAGIRFGQLTVVNRSQEKRHRSTVWECKCDCGSVVFIKANTLLSGYTKSCGCLRTRRLRTGTLSLCGTLLGNTRRGAEVRGIPWLVTDEELEQLFITQSGKCALSGEPIEATNKECLTASLDRKNSRLPYRADNVQWVHKDVNKMKQAFEQDCFLRWCSRIASYHKEQLCHHL